MCVLTLATTSANAGTLFALDDASDTLVSIDTNTKIFTDIGPLGTNVLAGDLAYDGSTLFALGGVGNNSLYTINTTTGAATLVGNHGVESLSGLAFDRSTGTLYGSGLLVGNGFYSLDLNTGTATLISGNPGVPISGMAYRGDTNQLVGSQTNRSGFYAIDPTTGNQTLLSNGAGRINSFDLAFDGDLGVYWLLDRSGNFYQYDRSLDSRTLITRTGRRFDGLAYTGSIGSMGAIPEPATWAMMIFGFGFVGGAMRRQRKANVKVSYA